MTTPAGDAIPRIFVSHAHNDNMYCRDYVAGLRAQGCYVWYDEHNLGWGALRPTIEREMPTCPHFVAILTPVSVASEWVNTEIDAALDLLKDGTIYTLTFVVAAPCNIPLLLRRWKRIEGPDGAAVTVAEAVKRTVAIVRPEEANRAAPPTTPPSMPTANDPRLVRARALAAEAREALTQNLLADAIAKASSALERFEMVGAQVTPAERTDVLLTLADACGRTGQWPRALDAAQRARKEDPDRLDCYLFQAAAQRELNQADQAQQTLDQARAIVPLSDTSQRLRFLAAQRALDASQQQWQRALATLDEEQRLAPTDLTLARSRLDLLSHWRAALSGQQQWTQALAVLDQELTLAPNEPARQGARLDLLQRAGQTQPALTLARQLTGQPNATAAEWLARARLARQVDGDHADQEVTAALDAATRLAPSEPAIAQVRDEVFPPIPAERFPARLADLGFTPRKQTHAGKAVEVIVPPLCPVPAGPFRMGSDPKQDSGAYDSKQPQHEVTLAAFLIARDPVTVAEYACFVRAGHAAPQPGTYQPITWDDQLKRLDHPVVCVSWHDATAYAAWLAQLTGEPCRLPTEAEWEKAARYDSATRASRIYPWGDAFDQSRANTSESGKGGTTPVGTYPTGASPCGAQDMAGNVWEWTSSVYKPYPYRADDGRERADSTENRVLRGGSWFYYSRYARAAYRNNYPPGFINDYLGFRVALVRAVPSS